MRYTLAPPWQKSIPILIVLLGDHYSTWKVQQAFLSHTICSLFRPDPVKSRTGIVDQMNKGCIPSRAKLETSIHKCGVRRQQAFWIEPTQSKHLSLTACRYLAVLEATRPARASPGPVFWKGSSARLSRSALGYLGSSTSPTSTEYDGIGR